MDRSNTPEEISELEEVAKDALKEEREKP